MDKEFCQKVLDFFFLNKASLHEEDFDFVRARNAKVYRVNYGTKECYLKVYAHKKISKKVQNNLQRRPEGIRNIKIALGLLDAGIMTAKPIFSATKRNFFTYDSMFFMEKAEGIDLEDYVKMNGLSGNRDVLKVLGGMWGKIIGNNFIHQDPTLGNMFIDCCTETVKITLIDIDDIYALPFSLPMKFALHSVARFFVVVYSCLFYNEKEPLNREDLNIFLTEFVNNCHREVSFSKITADLDRLIIKKIYEKKRQHIIPFSPVLSEIAGKNKKSTIA